VTANLKMFSTAEADFRANDRDWNHINDFWTGGRVRPLSSEARRGSTAADPIDHGRAGRCRRGAATGVRGPGSRVSPEAWLWILAPDAAVVSAQKGRSPSEFSIAAYPAEYGVSGRRTFIINESNVIFSKDLAGAFPTVASDDELRQWNRRPGRRWSFPPSSL
jgi:hypothetical protein